MSCFGSTSQGNIDIHWTKQLVSKKDWNRQNFMKHALQVELSMKSQPACLHYFSLCFSVNFSRVWLFVTLCSISMGKKMEWFAISFSRSLDRWGNWGKQGWVTWPDLNSGRWVFQMRGPVLYPLHHPTAFLFPFEQLSFFTYSNRILSLSPTSHPSSHKKPQVRELTTSVHVLYLFGLWLNCGHMDSYRSCRFSLW